MKVHVLVGEALDYDNRTTWLVRAYRKAEDATADMEVLNKVSRRTRGLLWKTQLKRLRKYDPSVQLGDFKTVYSVMEVEVVNTRMLEGIE